MKVSVIVPVYNTEQYLKECVDSILSQTYSDLEVILVDDGSTDGSGKICDEYQNADPRVRVIHQPNRGVSAARNVGVEAAKGEYIVFVDSDDKAHHKMIANLLALLTKEKTEAAFSKCTQISEHEMTIKGKTEIFTPDQAIEATLYQKGLDSSLCGKLFPAYAVKGTSQEEGKRYEDLGVFYKIYENIKGNIAATTAPLYYYRPNPQSFINNITQDRFDVLNVTKTIEEHYAGNKELLRAARDRRFSANFNMFVLATTSDRIGVADSCWQTIKSYRNEEIFNPQVRLKNKIGAIVSLFGKKAVMAAAKFVY